MNSRRNFIKISGAALGGAALLSHIPVNSFGNLKNTSKSFGFQVWTIRKELVNDFPGTLKKMADLGYKEVEMCSPLGYSGAGFEPLNHMSGREMRRIVEDAGLKCTSSHFNMGELREHLDNRIEWAHGLGMKQMMASSFGLPKDASIDDFRRAADELNAIGEKTKKAGLQMGFHNHHLEFEKRGDVLIYDALLDQLDPDLVKMQFQVAVVDIGYKAADYFRKHPGRFISAHLADYSAEQKKQVPIGQGIVDWDELFKAAKEGGVKNFYVEMAPDTFGPSAAFLTMA
ncbi:MAG: sugar phosphate isomerase/epimerase family protein [Mariniphaga sp.]